MLAALDRASPLASQAAAVGLPSFLMAAASARSPAAPASLARAFFGPP